MRCGFVCSAGLVLGLAGGGRKALPPNIGPGSPEWRQEFAGIDLTPGQIEQVKALKQKVADKGAGVLLSYRTDVREYNEGLRRVLTPEQLAVYQRGG